MTPWRAPPSNIAKFCALIPPTRDAALWLARLYRLQNEHDKAEAVLRTLLAREPENENGVEQLTQLLLDEGKSQEAISSLQEVLNRAPTAGSGNCWAMPTIRFTICRTPSRPIAKPPKRSPTTSITAEGLAQTLLTEEKYPEALEQYQRLTEMDADDPDNYLRLAEIYRQMKQLDKAEQNVLLAKAARSGQSGSDLLRSPRFTRPKAASTIPFACCPTP